MASLHLRFSLDSYEPKKHNNLCGTSACQLSDRSPFGSFLNCANGGGFTVVTSVSKLKHVHASRFESELVDGSVDLGQLDAGVESLRHGLGGENSVPHNSNSASRRKNGGRNIWQRFQRVRKLGQDRENARIESNGQELDVCDELDVGVYGIGPKSSSEHCNRILKVLETGSSGSEAMRLFEWMRCNGKLEGNVTAYNLVLRVLGRRGDWDVAEKLISEMRSVSGCELEVRVFNTVIYACSKKGLVDVGARWFHKMLDYGVEPNVATFGMLMGLYRKGWNVEEAEFAFCRMRKFNVKCQLAYSAMITIYTRLGLHTKAEEVIDQLSGDEVVANLENWLVMLNAYSQQGKLKEAESVLVSMQEAGFPPNIVGYNTLITGYGRMSNIDAAEQIFHNLPNLGLEPDETTYRSMIEGWARFGNLEKAEWYYEKLKALGFKPNSSNLYSMINLQAKHNDINGAVRTINDMVDMGCQPSSILGSLIQAYEKVGTFDGVPQIVRSAMFETVLVNQTACSILAVAYVKHSLVDEAIKLLKEKRWRDPTFEDNLYHLLICSCKELGRLESAVKIFCHMLSSDDGPNLHIFSTMIDIYSIMGRFPDADRTYRVLKSSGVAMDMVAYTIVVRMYVQAGNLEDACSVLEDMDKQATIVPDIYLLHDMLRLYQRCNKRDKLAELYYKILKSEVPFDQEMYNCVINCCAHALPVDELSRLFDEMIQSGFSPNTITYNVMLDVYGKSKLFRKARKVFWMARKQGLADVISYNTLIAAYGHNKNLRKMTTTVQLMQFNGFSVSLEAYNSMLDAYGKARQMEGFRSVLQRLKESSCTADHYTYNILINVYGEQGWIEEVAGVLTELKERGPGLDLCSYNTLIKAYGIAGMVEDAMDVIKEMRDNGIEPDRITYLNLISALQRNDKFLEAVRWSLWMKQMGLN